LIQDHYVINHRGYQINPQILLKNIETCSVWLPNTPTNSPKKYLYLQWLSSYSVVIFIYSDYDVILLWSLFTVIIMLFCCDHYLQWLSSYSVVIIIYSDYHVTQLWSLFTVIIIIFSCELYLQLWLYSIVIIIYWPRYQRNLSARCVRQRVEISWTEMHKLET